MNEVVVFNFISLSERNKVWHNRETYATWYHFAWAGFSDSFHGRLSQAWVKKSLRGTIVAVVMSVSVSACMFVLSYLCNNSFSALNVIAYNLIAFISSNSPQNKTSSP